MTITRVDIGVCFLKGESYLSLFYDDDTLDIKRFELQCNINTRILISIIEPDINEVITPAPIISSALIVVRPIKQWKMVEVVENEVTKIKMPPHLKINITWEAI